MDDYDVIIVGTGAGGGTLAHTSPRPGKRILLLERGDWLPRELDNWVAEAVFVDNATSRRTPGTTTTASRSSRRSTTSSAAPPSSTAQRSTGCGQEDFGELKHHDGISPAWPISYDEFEPYYTLAEQLYQVHGSARRGPDRAAGERAVPVPGRVARAADPAALRRPRGRRLPPVPRARAGSCSTRRTCRTARASAARPATASRASSTPSPTPRCSACARRSSTRTSRCSRTRKVVKLETNAAGTAVTAVVVERDGDDASAYAADIVVVACGAANTAKLLLQSANDKHPNGLANGSDQVGRNYMFHDSEAVLALSREENPTVFQKTLGLNDFYFGSDDFEYPLGNIQMVGKSQAPMFRGEKPGETKLAPDGRSSGSRATRSTSGSRPRTCRGPTTASPSTATASSRSRYTRDQRGGRRSGSTTKLKSMLGQARHEPGPPDPPLRVHEERHPGRRLRAPGGHVPVRHRPGDVGRSTPTARRTSSTTSTSSTRASSRASARSTRR